MFPGAPGESGRRRVTALGSPWVYCAGAAPLATRRCLLSVPGTFPLPGAEDWGCRPAGLVAGSKDRVVGSEFGSCARWDRGHSLRETWNRLFRQRAVAVNQEMGSCSVFMFVKFYNCTYWCLGDIRVSAPSNILGDIQQMQHTTIK